MTGKPDNNAVFVKQRPLE